MTDIELPYTATFNAIGDAVEQGANGIGISVKKFQAAFQPVLQAIVSQAHAAEIEAAREEGRRAGMMAAAALARRWIVSSPSADEEAFGRRVAEDVSYAIERLAGLVEAKAKEV